MYQHETSNDAVEPGLYLDIILQEDGIVVRVNGVEALRYRRDEPASLNTVVDCRLSVWPVHALHFPHFGHNPSIDSARYTAHANRVNGKEEQTSQNGFTWSS